MLLAETAVAAELAETAVAAEMSTAMDIGLVRQAMAFRVKYRVAKKVLSLYRLVVHPQNRGGMYPQPDTVRNLGLKILSKGFNQSEANHEGVCVEEIPYSERANHTRSDGLPYETYADYNIRQCDHLFLDKCFSYLNDIMYGTLSHSHLLLVLLSWANGAEWKLEDEPQWRQMLNPDGTFYNAAVAACDEGLDRVLRDGLDMEVLSWKMLVEEPTAASLISQALNSAQQMALRTSELTALNVLSGAVALELETAVAGEVCFETVREKVRMELDIYVDLPGFIDLFEFVVNMGAEKQSFIPQLREYGSKFVDPKHRQLSLQAFAEVNKVDLAYPRVKIAMLMRAYRKPPNRGWCPPPETTWTSTAKTQSLYKLERVLRYFQVTCKPAVAGMPPLRWATLSSNVACVAAEAFITCKEREKEGDAILSAVAKYFDEIKLFAESEKLDPPAKPDQAWLDFDGMKQRQKDTSAVADKEPAKLLPKVIMYDKETGVPINAQDVRAATGQEADMATVPWKEWLPGRVAQQLCDKATHIAAIQLVLNSLHTRGRIDEEPLDVSIDLNSKRKAVKASEDLPEGSLALPPCVPHASRVYDKSTHPHRVPIVVIEKSAVADGKPHLRVSQKGGCEPKRNVYYVHPEYKMPEESKVQEESKVPEESKEQVNDAVASPVRAWEFKGDETLHPFWAVERLTDDERKKAQKGPFNIKFEEKEYAAVTVGASGGHSIASTFSVVVPVMTTAVAVKKGAELLLEMTKKETKRKEGSWKTDVAKAEKAPKARAKAKTAANSLEVATEI